jgi:murein DD-endopeptidase MepM/ murein hydrolase activator NlpD
VHKKKHLIAVAIAASVAVAVELVAFIDRGGPAPSAGAAAPTPSTTLDLRARAEAAERAERSYERPSTSPSPSASPSTAPVAWVSPLPGARVTSCYGMRWGVLHAGVDLAVSLGTPIHAVGAGTVVSAGWSYPGYGISVLIDHGNGYLTHYAHQARTAVTPGQRVTAGQIIGYEGATGDVTGPHLHFEVHQGRWHQVEPVSWLRARGVPVGGC